MACCFVLVACSSSSDPAGPTNDASAGEVDATTDYKEVTASRAEVWGFLRIDGPERVLALFNFSDADVAFTVDLAAQGISAAKTKELIFGGALTAVTSTNAATWPVSLPKAGALWVSL